MRLLNPPDLEYIGPSKYGEITFTYRDAIIIGAGMGESIVFGYDKTGHIASISIQKNKLCLKHLQTLNNHYYLRGLISKKTIDYIKRYFEIIFLK